MRFLVAILLLLPTTAFAQQLTPSQAAVQITTVVNNMATAMERENQQLQEANTKIADLQKQLDDLKAKYEPKPKEK